jgi:hypothetical protein
MKPLNQMFSKDFSNLPMLLALQNENMYCHKDLAKVMTWHN